MTTLSLHFEQYYWLTISCMAQGGGLFSTIFVWIYWRYLYFIFILSCRAPPYFTSYTIWAGFPTTIPTNNIIPVQNALFQVILCCHVGLGDELNLSCVLKKMRHELPSSLNRYHQISPAYLPALMVLLSDPLPIQHGIPQDIHIHATKWYKTPSPEMIEKKKYLVLKPLFTSAAPSCLPIKLMSDLTTR